MADFNFHVSTTEMANSLQRVAHHVDDVTVAVRRMQDAVILADKAAADDVCSNVNRGFYTLIRSQISQKIARLKADVESKSMEMLQQSQSLRTFRQRMEQDYIMIARRYTKLFDSLNKSLRQRIFELDKFTTHFVHRSVSSLDNRVIHSSGILLVGSQENIEAQQKIIVSKTKGVAQLGVESIAKFIIDIKEQKQHISSILEYRRSGDQIIRYIPVAFVETALKGVAENSIRSYQPQTPIETLNNKIRWATQNILNERITSGNWSTQESASKSRIVNEFGNLVNSSAISERLKKEILRLFGDSNFQTLR